MFTVHRSPHNPLLSPDPDHPWEADATFNGCPIEVKDKIYLLYRAMSRPEILAEPKISHSVIGRAVSIDGDHFDQREPFIVPENDYEKLGCEDPRVTFFEGRYYIFYTALSHYPYNASNIKVALAISDDLQTISEKHLVTPFNAKAMSLFPERINGKIYALLTVDTDLPDTKIAVAQFDEIEEIWSEAYWQKWYQEIDQHTLIIPHNQDEQVEIGSAPIKTDLGWLLIYSHIYQYRSSGKPIFGIQALLLDLTDPQKIIGDTDQPFMVPEMYYEMTGIVSRIIFPVGVLIKKGNLEIYYGGADTHCCKATINLNQLLKTVFHKKGSQSQNELVTRYSQNPILTARPGFAWEAHGVFNPAAIELDGQIYILYRAMSDDDTSTIGLAISQDGKIIDERLNEPIYNPRGKYELKQHPGNSGCEDARIVKISDTLYIFYTAYDGFVPRIASSFITTKDFLNRAWNKWSEPQLVTPPEVANKDGALIPEKTKDGYVFLHRIEPSICADIFDSLDFSHEKITRCIEMIFPREGMWDGIKVGICAPAIKTAYGWLLLYHGVSANKIYSVGVALLDLDEPTTVLARSALPIFEPRTDYELHGVIPNVVFPCGTILRDDTLFIYYGGADTVVGVATASLREIIEILK